MNEKKTVDNNMIMMKDEFGKSVECEKLFTFESNETKKNYIVYTDHTKDESGALKVYASVYDAGGTSKELSPLESEEEWNTVEAILNKLQEQEKKE